MFDNILQPRDRVPTSIKIVENNKIKPKIKNQNQNLMDFDK